MHQPAAGPGERKLIDDAVKFLQEAPPQASDIALAFAVGLLAESNEDKQLALDTYADLADVFAASEDPKLAEVATVIEGVVRRLTLVGQEMKLEGNVLDGGALDWSKYRGKVALVLFWVTTCPVCCAEILDLKKPYGSYHAKGLEIVGFSLDGNLAVLRQFVKSNAIPWTIVAGEGKTNPTFLHYGVTGLPTTILVGKDGKVRGDQPPRRRPRKTVAETPPIKGTFYFFPGICGRPRG